MKRSTTGFGETKAWALSGASALVLGLVGVPLTATQAMAQDDVDEISDEEVDSGDTIVVTGTRSALKSAQDLKRDADTIVESITATDIGAFPDKSVAEALQRVAGITVNRFAASSDTAHFSAEPSGVIVRGLNQVRSEFNGRDTFSANSSRGLSWGDVSPELMAGVDTYKNQMAELIEGGIAGTINLRTRTPFDQAGQLFAVSANLNYGDKSDVITPEISGIYSNRWMTEMGEFGFMANYAYSDVTTKSLGVQEYRMNRIEAGAFPQYDGVTFFPAAINYRDNTYDRTRNGMALSGQWRSNDDSLLITTQFNRSVYENSWEEYVVQAQFADLSYGESVFYEVPNMVPAPTDDDPDAMAPNLLIPRPAPGTPDFTFNEQGLFQTGYLTTDIGWWGNNNDESANFARNGQGQNLVDACYGWNGCEPARRSPEMNTVTRSNNNRNMTQDVSLNAKWTPNDKWRFNFDIQHVESEVENYDIEVSINSFADLYVDLTGKYPSIALGNDPLNVNLSPGGLGNAQNYYLKHIMDHVEDSKGTQDAFRADVEYLVDGGWLTSIKAGARYAKRDQEVRWSGYNWQNVANVWTEDAEYFNITQTDSPCASDPSLPGCNGQAFTGYPAGVTQGRAMGDHFANFSPNEFVFMDINLLQDQEGFAAGFGADALGFTGGVGWNSICSNSGDRAEEIPGTCFTPAETVDLTEETEALYLQFNYGGPDAEIFGFPVSGNVGLRYVRTTDISSGGINVPLLSEEFFIDPNGPRTVDNLDCELRETTAPGAPPPNPPGTTPCYITQDIIDFADGTDQTSDTEANHENWLPSFNMKVELSDEWLVRFAASRAMSRPDIGNLRNYLGFGVSLADPNNSNDPLWIKDSSGTIIATDARYAGGAQNPFLAPVMATQFDVSLERYFADVGSFSFAMFYKEFEDYIQFGRYDREITNNGITETVEVRGPLNGEGAAIKGFEVSYQRFFDFLPEPFDGLGVQANYTFVDNQGITNSNVSNVGGEGTTQTAQSTDVIQVDRLEGLSDHSYNVVGMYEKGPFAARLAYNWRSEYLTTAIDCCVAYAIWTEDQGFLDGSVRYRLNDNMELSLQASNLLNTETVLRQQVEDADDGGLRLPNAWFQNDTRVTAGLRFKF
ncbi:TonB-dependent receptor [Parvularcula sp. LCG005]|uniref:TonB-dependent receptor n=1 Tax=Parvularcula sp. LCG005 TaxID=3078805 RepID=UPI002943608B|nr:TonB-dependent receptor [Parvularcula sp. LCG005]WOI53451.1 TonB-dependent receptor [Parvularcula sp. LCG005]